MKKFTYMDLAALIIWLLPLVYLAYIYSSLPAVVPVHYGIDGKVNRYGNKSELVIMHGIILGTGLLVYLLLKYLPAIDPKKQVMLGEATFQKLAFGVVTFLSVIAIVITFSTIRQGFKITAVILPIAGLLFAFIGNMMHSIKPNYFAGVRTPWTLESPDTWRVTHRLAGKLWFFGGIVIALAALVLPVMPATIVFMCGLAVLTLVPVIYSYIYFKNHQTN